MRYGAKKWLVVGGGAILSVSFLAIVTARPAVAAPPTPGQICQFKKLKAAAVFSKKLSVCGAKLLKTPGFPYSACVTNATGVFDNAIENIESAGGCDIENQRNLLYVDVSLGAALLFAEVTPPSKRVFVTSTTTNGNLGFADYICQNLADAAELGPYARFQAWIGDSTSSPSTRSTRAATVPYVLVDDSAVVADNWNDLIDGTLQHAIDMDELGNTVGSPISVWTGTTTSGTSSGTNCLDWTSGSGADFGSSGVLDQVDSDWTAQGNSGCHNLNRIYCIEQ